MTDYIKREDAIQAFDPQQRQDWYTPWIVETLKDLPSADVAPVVRCKDCKHWQPSEYGVVEQPYCKHLGYKEENGLDIRIGNENDFCSFGERKDDD